MNGIGVAISTTGDLHRMPLLRQCVEAWDEHLPRGASLFVTVDGDEQTWERVYKMIAPWTASVLRVGQPVNERHSRDGLLGVAANKNTGLEALMDRTFNERLFLCDDDTWPKNRNALLLHTEIDAPHSMVAWGRHRRGFLGRNSASWTWPRGSLLYVTRAVVDQVGGMIEEFGPGGHEHVEWSRRIFNAGLTPTPYLSPVVYTERNYMGAAMYWHCEDMPRPGESRMSLISRRRHLTSVRREAVDRVLQDRIMERMATSADFVDYRAIANGRLSATLSPITGA